MSDENNLTPDEIKALQEFARMAIRISWEGGDFDGADIQENAESLGLIVPTPGGYNPEIHGPDDYAEPGDRYFVFAPFVEARAALSRATKGDQP